MAKIRQQYASMGLTGSTMEAQALQANEVQTAQATTQAAMGLYNAGLQTLGMATDANKLILSQALMKDQAMAQLIAEVAGMAGQAGNKKR